MTTPHDAPPSTRSERGWRDNPTTIWLAVAAIVGIGVLVQRRLVPHSTWLVIHAIFLGALTHAAVVWSTHFAQALLKTAPEVDPRARQTRRIATLFVGVATVLVAVVTEAWAYAVAGAVLVSVAILWHAVALWRRLRAALGARFRVTLHFYLAAAAWVPVGATAGVWLAREPSGDLEARLVVVHTSAMALGWIGFTVMGTLVTLWPTMLRTRIDPRAESLARTALPILNGALALIVVASTLGSRLLTALGFAAYLVGVVWWGRALHVPLRARAPRELAPLAVAAALCWATLAVGWITSSLLFQPDWESVETSYGVPAAMLVGGFAPQLLLGALSYLVPAVLGGGPAAVRAARSRIDRYAVLRLVVVNLGVALAISPFHAGVRAGAAAAALTAYLGYLPLIALAVRDSRRARTLPRAAKVTGPSETAPKLDVYRDLVIGLAVLAVAVLAGVLADPVPTWPSLPRG